MNIIIASISGGFFPVQLLAMRKIMKCSKEPDIMLTGSGGTVSAYCAMSSGWNISKFDVITSNLETKLFIKTSHRDFFNFLPECAIGYFSGFFYESSEIIYDFMNNFLSEENVKKIEIWSCAINIESGRVGLFSNMSTEKSKIDYTHYDMSLFNSEKLNYMNGDINFITKAILASASIPILLKPVNINNQKYSDCGTKFGSSLTPLQKEIQKITFNTGCHIIYISGYNVSDSLRKIYNYKSENIGDLFELIPSQSVRGLVQQDRMVAYNLIKDGNKKVNYAKANIDSLSEIINNRKNIKSSLIEIFAKKFTPIDLFNFTGKNVHDSMLSCTLGIRIWWCGKESVFSGISSVVIKK